MNGAVHWGQRFQELTADAGRMSTRSLRRYQELLDRVARGDLQPEHVQQQIGQYLQEHAAGATRDLVELSVGLLAGLLYAEAKYREGLLEGLLPPDAPIPPPPDPAGVELAQWFQALTTYATEQNARSVARYQQLVERVAAGELSPADVQQHSRRFLEGRAPAFLDDVMNLGLTFVGRLQSSSSSLTDGLYDRVLGPEPAAERAPDPPLCLDLGGPSGSVATAKLVVENTRAEAAEVTCRSSDFMARAFGRRFPSRLVVQPSRFRLEPGAQQDVELRLALDPSVFTPGADYAATLQISGAGERDQIVQMLVHVAPGVAPDVAAAGPPAPAAPVEPPAPGPHGGSGAASTPKGRRSRASTSRKPAPRGRKRSDSTRSRA